MCYKDFFDLKRLTTKLNNNSFPYKRLNGNPFKITKVKMFKMQVQFILKTLMNRLNLILKVLKVRKIEKLVFNLIII